ncbi:hypothetical protein DFJ58DRAFT_733834 [Suillus subalutaceus]|uniref:uncharacterized protein n=1 Tax=Suillus subalutaceus TaxID=48586 RepID=UPI001B8660E0|nr:uncharacterized protein DFJ58DRAFT_733834 [Suillus subalutaceus]KAG1838461.1 hypothetical protein DFJ58DRAFT_733834 [Suillus subalutaceus]
MSYRVLVVLDPQFSRALVRDSYGCIDWVTHDYPALLAADLLDSPTLCGFVFPGQSGHLVAQRPGFVPVRLHEKVWMSKTAAGSRLIPVTHKLLFWLRIRHKGITVEFMKFENFRDILISPNSDFKQTFQQYHSVCGGLDLMVDPRQAGGWGSSAQLQQYIYGLQMLESIVPVWPPSREILRASIKFNVIINLDQIASRMVNSPRPRTTLLSRNDVSQSFAGWILKREGSDCNRHVLLPGKVDPLNLPPDCGHFRWLKQSYVPTLRKLGEWRIILVDCLPLWVVHTAPGNRREELVFLHRDAGRPSLRIREPYVFDDIMDPVGGTCSERRQADQELESFATTVLSQLIEVEEDLLGAPSSLRLMVRLDIGVMHGPDGQLGYFINEVERGVGIGLFTAGNPRWTLRLADEFGCSFSKWMTKTCLAMERLIEPVT